MFSNAVPVDDNFGMMLNWAVRYSLGRMTYAVSSTCQYIKPLVTQLNDKTLCVMHDDIVRQEKFGYGHDCDKENWLNLLAVLRAEMKRRGLEIYEGGMQSECN